MPLLEEAFGHHIVEPWSCLGWKRASGSSGPTIVLSYWVLSLTRVPQCHVHASLKYLQGWRMEGTPLLPWAARSHPTHWDSEPRHPAGTCGAGGTKPAVVVWLTQQVFQKVGKTAKIAPFRQVCSSRASFCPPCLGAVFSMTSQCCCGTWLHGAALTAQPVQSP